MCFFKWCENSNDFSQCSHLWSMRHCDHHELYECDFSNFVMKSLIFYMIHNGSIFDLLHEQFFCEFLKKNFVKMTYHKCHITGGYSTLGFMFLSGDICHLAFRLHSCHLFKFLFIFWLHSHTICHTSRPKFQNCGTNVGQITHITT